MGMIKCFWIEPMPLANRILRRFQFSDKRPCPARPDWGCDASVEIEDVEVPLAWMMNGSRIGGYGSMPSEDEIKQESRWPTTCEACQRPFNDDDRWQVITDQYYSDGKTMWLISHRNPGMEPPPGAMWHCFWMDDIWPGPDGRSIAVMTPGGPWNIDGPASNSPAKHGWSRTGAAPDLVVTPSINIEGKYHGWLGNGGAPPGFLLEC